MSARRPRYQPGTLTSYVPLINFANDQNNDQVKMEIESTHDYDDDFIKVYPLNKSTQVSCSSSILLYSFLSLLDLVVSYTRDE